MTKAKDNFALITEHVDRDDDIGEIADIVGFHIRLAHGAVYRHFTETFLHLDLTQKQVTMLWLVDLHSDIAQAGLARLMRMDRATTMAIINRLQERGLLVRGKSIDDGRKKTLNLTQKGLTMLRQAKDVIAQHENWLKERFTDKEVVKLIELLTRIHG